MRLQSERARRRVPSQPKGSRRSTGEPEPEHIVQPYNFIGIYEGGRRRSRGRNVLEHLRIATPFTASHRLLFPHSLLHALYFSSWHQGFCVWDCIGIELALPDLGLAVSGPGLSSFLCLLFLSHLHLRIRHFIALSDWVSHHLHRSLEPFCRFAPCILRLPCDTRVCDRDLHGQLSPVLSTHPALKRKDCPRLFFPLEGSHQFLRTLVFQSCYKGKLSHSVSLSLLDDLAFLWSCLVCLAHGGHIFQSPTGGVESELTLFSYIDPDLIILHAFFSPTPRSEY